MCSYNETNCSKAREKSHMIVLLNEDRALDRDCSKNSTKDINLEIKKHDHQCGLVSIKKMAKIKLQSSQYLFKFF